MNLKLIPGRPEDESSRLSKEIRVYDLLDNLNILYDRVDHEPLETMEACSEVDELLNAIICKNLFLCNSQKTLFYLLMMPGHKKFQTKQVSRQIQSARLSFANEEYLLEFLDITPGSVSVMGLMNDKEKRVQLLIDEEILESEYFGCHPCINTSSLRIKVKDLTEKFLKTIDHEYIAVKLVEEL